MTPKTTLSEQPTLPIDLGPSTSDRPEETEERFGQQHQVLDGSGTIVLRDAAGHFDGINRDYATYDA